MNHSTPTAVIVSADRYEALLDELEDLKDRLSIHERAGVTIPAEKLLIELGLA
jgi:antitoxin StbD